MVARSTRVRAASAAPDGGRRALAGQYPAATRQRQKRFAVEARRGEHAQLGALGDRPDVPR